MPQCIDDRCVVSTFFNFSFLMEQCRWALMAVVPFPIEPTWNLFDNYLKPIIWEPPCVPAVADRLGSPAQLVGTWGHPRGRVTAFASN